MIRTKFWGVRGSIPVPGAATAGVGGNTSCVQVMCGDTHIVFDAGTGLRLLGAELVRKMPVSVHLFISHVHWDHIQGFPFFAPAFVGGNKIHMYGASNSRGTVESAMAGQMEFPNFPVKLSELGSELIFHHVGPGDVVHAEINLIASAARLGISLQDSSVLITELHPCANCAGALAQAGVLEVHYPISPGSGKTIKQEWLDNFEHAQTIFRETGVQLCPF